MNSYITKKVFLFVIISFLLNSLSAQYESRGKEFNFIDAEIFFYNNNYHDALGLYELLIQDYPKIKKYQINKGICHLKLNNPKEAIKAILASKDKKKVPENYAYYLAKAYALNYQFDSAIYFFKEGEKAGNTNDKFKKLIPHLIGQCESGKELIKEELAIDIINIDSPINSEEYEYSPVVNGNETILAYTYRGRKSTGGRQSVDGKAVNNGNFYDDIYVSYKENEAWGEPELLNRRINTSRNETSIGMSSDGSMLYAYRSTVDKSGQLYSIENKKGEFLDLEELQLNSSDWEGSVSVSGDGLFAIFSSDRKGGLGGSDLYIMKKTKGVWSDPVNMGDKINTEYEEEVPFIYPNNKMFSFSSQGHSSMGGYDIFESQINDEGEYSEPRNLGYPINTTYNDLFFSISGKGNAFFSSLRKEGKGQHDIYTFDIEPTMEKSSVILLKGKVNAKECMIKIKNAKGESRGEYFSDSKTGNYKAYLPLGEDYKVSYVSDGVELKSINVLGKKVTKFKVVEENVGVQNEVASTQNSDNSSADKFKFDLANPANFELFMKTYGDKAIADVEFFVQIGAYSDPSFFNYKKWNKLGKVTQDKLKDGITRFTIGTYDSFIKAKKITEKAKKIGDKDAFVLVYYKGERTSLNKLIDQGVYQF